MYNLTEVEVQDTEDNYNYSAASSWGDDLQRGFTGYYGEWNSSYKPSRYQDYE